MKIRTYLLLMIGAIIVPLFLLAAIALRTLLHAEREAALRTLSETASATALLVDRELGSSESALRVLARSPHLANGDMAGFYRHANSADRGDGGRTILFAPNGQQLINTVVPLGVPLPPPPAYVQVRTRRVIATQKTVVSGLISGAVQKIPVTTINIPVPLDGGRRYVLASVFSPDYFTRVIARRPLPSGWKLSVVDTAGHLIARSGEAARFGQFANPALMRAAAGRNDGLARYDTRSGTDAYHAFFRSPMSGWLVTVSAPARAIEGTARQAVTLVAAGMLLALLCAAAAAALFGRRLLRSIEDAGRSAAMLSRGQVPPGAGSAIAEVDRLQHALHEAGSKLARAAGERTALLHSEQEARVLAEQQLEARDNFLAMLSHELRNPLSGIVGATQLLRTGPASAALKERALDILLRQSKHLTLIVDDLLDLARLARGKVELEKQPVDLADVTRTVVDALLVGGRVAHDVHCTLAPAWIDADPTRIEQVVGNLVGNALKYTPAGGRIDIALAADDGQAWLTVRDDGIGIAPELLPRLFDIFTQGKVSLDRSQGGLGIGLAVVRSLVLLHGGTISAASDGPGKGSTFTLRLPLLAAADTEGWHHAPTRSPAAMPDEQPEPSMAGGVTVLLIEDNDDARAMLAAQLAAAGCHVIEADNGGDGIALARRMRPALAIVDIGLPGMDGYQIAAALRAEPALAAMRLLALTGYGQPADRQRALGAGFDRHFTKPLGQDQLAQVLDELRARAAA